jgi:hypothetical protein
MEAGMRYSLSNPFWAPEEDATVSLSREIFGIQESPAQDKGKMRECHPTTTAKGCKRNEVRIRLKGAIGNQ